MRLSEVYTSTQGEGPKVGIPTTFVRFAGCNLKCAGWACDTQHAIDPKLYRKDWLELGPEQILEMILDETGKTGARNVCFTGGEPFLQEHDRLLKLISMCAMERLDMEVFTNGTIEWPHRAMHRMNFVMDWKLSGSGENVRESDAVWQNALRLGPKDAIKFTVASDDDLGEAYDTYMRIQPQVRDVQFFVGPVWGKMEPSVVVDWMLRMGLPWRLNIQAHKYIWPADARRT
jgi:7-carboxy-7-deazaguanine synthase